MYANGLGATNPAVPNGQLVTAPIPLAATPVVTFNGVAAQVVYAGLAASGLYQLNVIVPSGLPNGDAAMEVQTSTAMSPAGAFITVQN